MRLLERAFVLAWVGACTNDIDFPAKDRDDEPAGAGASTAGSTSGNGEPTPGPCQANAIFLGGDDGCAADEYCYPVDPNQECLANSNCPSACAKATPCPPDGACDPGTFGAVCNDGLFPTKARTCYTGRCEITANCPEDFTCVGAGEIAGLGYCSSGAPLMPCTSDRECKKGSCVLFGPIGFCSL